MKKKIFPFIIIIVFLTLVFAFVKNNEAVKNVKYIEIGGQVIKIELAVSNSEKEKGLSGREELGAGVGMLFVFETPGPYAFWMKDMKFPIDIIWLNEDLKIIYIKKDAFPESYPDRFGPAENAKYVLEVAAGFSEKNNLKVGDSAEFLSQ